SVRDVYERKTVARLAEVVSTDRTDADGPDDGVGEVPLTPIVRRFAERGGPIGHFSQSQLLRVPARLGQARVIGALAAVLARHDALRLQLAIGADGWRLDVLPPGAVDATALVRRVDVSDVDDVSSLLVAE